MTLEQELEEITVGLEEQRTFLINQLATTYDSDELHKYTGRLFQIQSILATLKQLEKDDKNGTKNLL